MCAKKLTKRLFIVMLMVALCAVFALFAGGCSGSARDGADSEATFNSAVNDMKGNSTSSTAGNVTEGNVTDGKQSGATSGSAGGTSAGSASGSGGTNGGSSSGAGGDSASGGEAEESGGEAKDLPETGEGELPIIPV